MCIIKSVTGSRFQGGTEQEQVLFFTTHAGGSSNYSRSRSKKILRTSVVGF